VGGRGPSSSVGALGIVLLYSLFSARLTKGALCSSRRSPGSSHSLTTFALPLFTLSASPPYPRVVVATYSRSPKNPALQLSQKSSKSASTTPQRPIWNSFALVGVRDFWENGCKHPFFDCG